MSFFGIRVVVVVDDVATGTATVTITAVGEDVHARGRPVMIDTIVRLVDGRVGMNETMTDAPVASGMIGDGRGVSRVVVARLPS